MLIIEFDLLPVASISRRLSPIVAKHIQLYAQVRSSGVSDSILTIYDRYEQDEVSRVPLKQLLDVMHTFISNNNKVETNSDNIVTVRLPRLSRSLDQELQFPSRLINRVQQQQQQQQPQIVIIFEFL